MVDSIITKDRLTIMMPIVEKKDIKFPKDWLEYARLNPQPIVEYKGTHYIDQAMAQVDGRQLVHNILVRKGNTYLKYPSGRFKPVAQAMLNKNMERLRSNENPADIVRDMQAQLLLL